MRCLGFFLESVLIVRLCRSCCCYGVGFVWILLLLLLWLLSLLLLWLKAACQWDSTLLV